MTSSPQTAARRNREVVVNYLEQPLGRFLDLMASDEPAPGGGAAAALAVAFAASLASMSARLSTEQLADSSWLVDRTGQLKERVASFAQEDAAVYGNVIAAQRNGAKDREQRVRAALSDAADVPLAVAEVGTEVAGIAARLVAEGNPNLRGDAIAAVLLAEAGVRAASTLVEINLGAAKIRDERLGRADELTGRTAATRRAVEGG